MYLVSHSVATDLLNIRDMTRQGLTTPRFLQSSSSLRRSVRFLWMILWRRDKCVKSNMFYNKYTNSPSITTMLI